MFIKSLTLRNFRNYASLHVLFGPGLNVIYGKNGQGKTNLLEAVHIICTGRSFRTRDFSHLMRKDNGETFTLAAEIEKDGFAETITIHCEGEKREVRTNQGKSPYLASLLGTLPIIFLSANDPSLISGLPNERRRFFDLHLAQIDPLYLQYLNRYHKALKQKNALLRSKDLSLLAPWEKIMAQSAQYIIQRRSTFISELEPKMRTWVDALSLHNETLSLSYRCSLSSSQSEEEIILFWQKEREKEMQREMTLHGPHRDDIVIEISGQQARAFASEGQKRTCGTALCFAEWQAMKERLQQPPLLAIDDFGVQLDPYRREQLHTQLQSFGQVFLTLPDPDPSLLSTEGAKLLHIDSGTL